MREFIRDTVALAGLGFATYGIWCIFPPAAWIVLGGSMLAGAALWPPAKGDS